jgi:hypothetical protein
VYFISKITEVGMQNWIWIFSKSYSLKEHAMAFLELRAEFDYYKELPEENEAARKAQRVINEDSYTLNFKKWEELYGQTHKNLSFPNIVSVEEIENLASCVFSRTLTTQYLFNIEQNYPTYYHGPFLEKPDLYSYWNIKFNRNFIKDMYKLPESMRTLILYNYLSPLSRGQIMDRSYLSNYRKYSEDSYEFYVPVEGGLILTWRLFADVNIQGDSNSKSGLAFVLMYTLSFDAVCDYEYKNDYVLDEVSPLVTSILSKAQNCPLHDNPRMEQLGESKYIVHATIAFFLKTLKYSDDDFKKENLTNFWKIQTKYKDIKTYFMFFPRCKNLKEELTYLQEITLSRAPSYPQWLPSRLSELTDRINTDSVDKDSENNTELLTEYRDLKNLVDTAYEIYTCESIKYTSFLQKLPKHIQVFYEKVDDDILMNSLQKSKILDDRFSGVQKKVAFTGKNVLFFGRSGTGKTHCCTHALVSRYLTADAIERKMSKKSTDIKNDTNISGLKSIFITASALLAKEVKAQYETTLKRVETINAKEEIRVLTEEKIFDSLQAVQSRGKELPKSFFETDIQWPLFLSHQEFVSILYNTMLEGNTDFKQMEQRVKIDANDDGNITINRR